MVYVVTVCVLFVEVKRKIVPQQLLLLNAERCFSVSGLAGVCLLVVADGTSSLFPAWFSVQSICVVVNGFHCFPQHLLLWAACCVLLLRLAAVCFSEVQQATS